MLKASICACRPMDLPAAVMSPVALTVPVNALPAFPLISSFELVESPSADRRHVTSDDAPRLACSHTNALRSDRYDSRPYSVAPLLRWNASIAPSMMMPSG